MSVSDRLLGLLGGGMVLAAVVLLVAGGERDAGARPDPQAPPPPELLEPSDGQVVSGPVAVVFRTPRALEIGPGGWGTGEHHLHLEMDGIELMPRAADLERLSEGVYRWTLPPPPEGTRTLRLLWSGPDHRPIPGTETEPVRIRVR